MAMSGSSWLHAAPSAPRKAVDRAKTALGERGRVWWNDGTPDYNRKNVRNTPYASWYAEWSETK